MELGGATAFLVSSLAVVINGLRFRDALYPAFIHASIWFAIVLGLHLSGDAYYRVNHQTYFLVAIGIVAFSAGCYTATFQFSPLKRLHVEHRPSRIVAISLLFATVAGSLFPLLLLRAAELASSGPTDNFLLNLRISRTQDEQSLGIGAYGSVVATVGATICVLHRKFVPKVVMYAMILLALAYATVSTGRTSFLLLILAIGGALTVTRSIGVLRVGGVTVAVFGAIFFAIGAVLSKGFSIEGDQFPWIEAFETLRNYLLAPLAAFDALVRSDPSLANGENLLRFWLALLARLGLDVTAPPLVQEFVFVPVATNVYTVYQPYFLDFGFLGAAAVQFPLGVLHGIAYRSADKGHDLGVLVYSLMLYPLAMQFFQDQYFNLLSTWLQVGVCLLVYWIMTRKRLLQIADWHRSELI